MSTWVALLLANAFSLTNGGLAGTVWVYLATWICTFALAASLAEMASMAPTSGGQYRRFISFVLEAFDQPLTLQTQIGSLNLHHVRRANFFPTSLAGWPRLDGKHLLLPLVSLRFSLIDKSCANILSVCSVRGWPEAYDMTTDITYNRHTPLQSSSCPWPRSITQNMQCRTGMNNLSPVPPIEMPN